MGIYGIFTIYNCGIDSHRMSAFLLRHEMKKSNWIYSVTSIKSHKLRQAFSSRGVSCLWKCHWSIKSLKGQGVDHSAFSYHTNRRNTSSSSKKSQCRREWMDGFSKNGWSSSLRAFGVNQLSQRQARENKRTLTAGDLFGYVFFLKLKGKKTKTKKGSQNYSNSADVTRMDWSRLRLSSSMPWGSCWKGSIHRTKVLKEAPSNQQKTVVTLLSQATRFGNTNQQNALEFLIMPICRWGGSSK